MGASGARAAYRHARCAALEKNVEGVVWRGPITNVCREGTPCGAPAAGVPVQALESGRLVAETRTGDDGRFTFALAAGHYTIRLVTKDAPGHRTKPQTVTVAAATPVHLSFSIDTGIR